MIAPLFCKGRVCLLVRLICPPHTIIISLTSGSWGLTSMLQSRYVWWFGKNPDVNPSFFTPRHCVSPMRWDKEVKVSGWQCPAKGTSMLDHQSWFRGCLFPIWTSSFLAQVCLIKGTWPNGSWRKVLHHIDLKLSVPTPKDQQAVLGGRRLRPRCPGMSVPLAPEGRAALSDWSGSVPKWRKLN